MLLKLDLVHNELEGWRRKDRAAGIRS